MDVAAAFEEFNLDILDSIAGRCSVVKPQSACYEAYGAPGWRALESTIAAARQRGFIVILDAKRADVGSTATHYGQMAFGGAPDLGDSATSGIGADWMTVNPYLGADGVEPIIDASPSSHVGILVLVKTSNPSSGDLQDTSSGDATVSDAVADRVAEWGAKRMGGRGLSDVGAVVGATYPDQARRLRERMPNTIFLVPGYGAQGAGPADALAGLRTDGRGVLVSSSRGIIGAWQDEGTDEWGEAAGAALDAMNAALDRHR